MTSGASAALALAAIGTCAGALTTVSGVGGALIALAATSLVIAPRDALAVTAAALLAGSIHRAWAYRREVEAGLAVRLGLGSVAGALAGAQLVRRLPEPVLRAVLVAVAGLAIGAAVTGIVVRMAPRAMIAAGVAIGIVGASSGGAALLIAPVLQAVGLRGARYLGTAAAIAVIFNAARVAAYLEAALYDRSMIGDVAVLAAACVAGNVIGAHARGRIPAHAVRAIELGAPVVALVVALVAA